MGKKTTDTDEAVAVTAKVKNRTKRAVVCNLPCKQYCVDACVCTKVEQVVDVYKGATGEHEKQLLERKWNQSITWLAGETKDVPLTVLNCPEVTAAIAQSVLVRL